MNLHAIAQIQARFSLGPLTSEENGNRLRVFDLPARKRTVRVAGVFEVPVHGFRTVGPFPANRVEILPVSERLACGNRSGQGAVDPVTIAPGSSAENTGDGRSGARPTMICRISPSSPAGTPMTVAAAPLTSLFPWVLS